MLLALIGLDEFAKEDRIVKIREQSVKDGLPFKVFFASSPKDNISFTAEISSALAASFFEPAANVLARHCEFLPAEELRRLTDFMSRGVQGNLILDFTELDKRSALWKFLEKSNATEIGRAHV